ncbi:hypothetical protein LEMA_P109020.1 [Plenodomus lingam JN3]|uniref:Uncharacterized protein n=1 Tax=Leptosphaeria maculans (strain JN3 / isolate v23.1.3 / race Av1-4-5-6-7-8) TaxID=985895 RepID=E4ZZ42_LEPMJ|nr:hypothetical protein LEMA_P109020.1 [Plenodomus lingam JN3]CBX96637.1 hypothetical protein LEMA_P109020.1 [Plenodomus lingam JN3]
MEHKRRKIDLFATHRARNGGADDSFLDPTSNPNLNLPSGSDTESEPDQEVTAQKYLNMKRDDDADRPVETVFGPDVNLRRSKGGTMYAEQVRGDGGKRKRRALREGEDKVEVRMEQGRDKAKDDGIEEQSGNLYPSLPPSLFTHLFPPLPATVSFSTPQPPAIPSSPPISSILPPFLHPARNPTATKFHHSSAAIDPRGAYNRPIRPLPRRSEQSKVDKKSEAATQRIVSGSFESIGEDLRGGDRFRERGYRLQQSRGGGGLKETEVKEKEGKGGEVVDKNSDEEGGGKENAARHWLRNWLRRL